MILLTNLIFIKYVKYVKYVKINKILISNFNFFKILIETNKNFVKNFFSIDEKKIVEFIY